MDRLSRAAEPGRSGPWVEGTVRSGGGDVIIDGGGGGARAPGISCREPGKDGHSNHGQDAMNDPFTAPAITTVT